MPTKATTISDQKQKRLKSIFAKGLLLAPLAGFSDVAQRQISSQSGADLCYTEMVSAKGLVYGNAKTAELLQSAPNQKLKAVQLFGSEPAVFERALIGCKELRQFEVADINMGCPVHKIVSCGEGSALMKDIKRAADIISVCARAAPDKMITAKIRSGWDGSNINAVAMAKALEESGAQAITVHARTREQYYAGECDYELVSRVREAVSVPVIVSGGITDVASYEAIRARTGCGAVMIGRGALGSNIFNDIKAHRDGAPKQEWNAAERYLYHLKLLHEYFGEKYAVANIRKFTPYYFRRTEGARALRHAVNTAGSIAEIKAIITELA